MTRERLRNYRALKKEKQQLLHLLEELDSEMTSPRGPSLSGMPRGGSDGGRLEAIILQREELLRRYREKIAEMDAELLEIEAAIEGLTDSRERTILRLYYIEGLTWERVCVHPGVCYSWQQTHRIHARALRHLAEK